jgi:hypothetical protein
MFFYVCFQGVYFYDDFFDKGTLVNMVQFNLPVN